MVFIGATVYIKNQREGQRQVEFQAWQAGTRSKNADGGPHATAEKPTPAQDGQQSSNPDALLDIPSETNGQTLDCRSKSTANLQRCYDKNNIQNGSDEASALSALARRGHAEFQSVPHESGGKCYTDVKITGKYQDKDIDRLLKDCEVD